MSNLLASLHQQINDHGWQHRRFVIAYSGGLDSTVLLHQFKQLTLSQPHFQVRAIHIHHGLSPNADHWQKHCQLQCTQWQMPFNTYSVDIAQSSNIEAQARLARYQCFQQQLADDEILVTAHHLDDQSETFLLALKRGSGIKGLAAMQTYSQLFNIQLFRPLLHFQKTQLLDYAHQHQLHWIEDESNQNEDFDRNFLRQQILPKLRQRWQHIDKMIQRSAQHCYQQQLLIDELLQPEFQQRYDAQKNTLNIAEWHTLSVLKQAALLRLWLQQLEHPMPTQKQLSVLQEMADVQHDRQPELQLGDKVVRRYQHQLYLTPHFADLSEFKANLVPDQWITLPDQLGKICLTTQQDHYQLDWLQFNKKLFSLTLPPTDELINLRFNYSGKVRLSPRHHHQDIKKIWQKYQIAPWQRQRTPLLFYGDQLIAALGVFKIQESAKTHLYSNVTG